MKAGVLLSVLALLAACGGSADREAGGATAAEADALDRAAEMVEDQRLPDEAIPQPADPAPVQSPPPAQTPAATPSG